MNWKEEVEKRRDEIIKETQSFLRIKSVLDEETKAHGAPFGEGINNAFLHLLKLGESFGFTTKNLEGYAGHIELKGSGEDIVGVLCHIDVVPEGDGWTSDPFGADIRDGKIFARGAIDDKGPTIAALFAMKIVKDLNLPLTHNVRMIVGTDEESEWRCVDHYFKHEKMPALGFAPDADFPIIFAEKGLFDAILKQTNLAEVNQNDLVLLSFQSGRRFNMVPDYAQATIKSNNLQNIKELYSQYITENEFDGEWSLQGDEITFKIRGVSAHAMEPNNGVNAGIQLSRFLNSINLDVQGNQFVKTIAEYFEEDTRGKKLNLAYADDVSGELTVNLGIMSYSHHSGGELGVNIRYPVTADTKKIIQGLSKISGFELKSTDDVKPHHIDKQHPLIQKLQQVYEEQTGEKAELLSIGGGTYARSLEAGVAFGPMFPGRADVAHQKDEYIIIEDLLKATAIYAQAIYELAK